MVDLHYVVRFETSIVGYANSGFQVVIIVNPQCNSQSAITDRFGSPADEGRWISCRVYGGLECFASIAHTIDECHQRDQ